MRQKVLGRFKREMWVHHKLQEIVFYATSESHRDTKVEASAAVIEHQVANGLPEELDSMPVDSPERLAKCGFLSE